MTPLEWMTAVQSAGIFLTGVAALWGVAVGKRGVKVSTENKDALATVQLKQTTNKDEIKTEILAVRHDFKNGGGEAIADKVVAQIKPVLEETGKVITDQVALTNANVAAALAEKTANWDGVERRVGPADRRGR